MKFRNKNFFFSFFVKFDIYLLFQSVVYLGVGSWTEYPEIEEWIGSSTKWSNLSREM
jgi:hypothetical protein